MTLYLNKKVQSAHSEWSGCIIMTQLTNMARMESTSIIMLYTLHKENESFLGR